MTMIDLSCPACGLDLSVPGSLQGKQVRCARCQHVFRAVADDLPPMPDADDLPPMRLDQRPHRGSLIQTLGIVSLVMAPASIFSCGFLLVLALPLGITTAVLGYNDLQAMAQGELDRDKGQTKTGMICGIIATLVSILCIFAFAALFIAI